jgi:hypothetical protein
VIATVGILFLLIVVVISMFWRCTSYTTINLVGGLIGSLVLFVGSVGLYTWMTKFSTALAITLAPFTIAMGLSTLFYCYRGDNSFGLPLLLSTLVWTVVVWSFLVNKAVVFWASPFMICIAMMFTLHEILLILEYCCCPDRPVRPWTTDLKLVILRSGDKIREWQGEPPVQR